MISVLEWYLIFKGGRFVWHISYFRVCILILTRCFSSFMWHFLLWFFVRKNCKRIYLMLDGCIEHSHSSWFCAELAGLWSYVCFFYHCFTPVRVPRYSCWSLEWQCGIIQGSTGHFLNGRHVHCWHRWSFQQWQGDSSDFDGPPTEDLIPLPVWRFWWRRWPVYRAEWCCREYDNWRHSCSWCQ